MRFKKYSNNKTEEKDVSHQFNLRINLFFFSTFVIFSIIIIRLAILQFVEGPELSDRETSSETKNFSLQPIRGTIFDASGIPLAYSKPSNALYITLLKSYDVRTDLGKENYPEINQIADRIAEVFVQYGDSKEKMTKKEIIKALDLQSKKWNGYEPRRIKGDLTEREVAYIIENKDDFPGALIVEENVRFYDKDTVAVQTIGYLSEFKGSKTVSKYAEIDQLNKAQKDPGLKYSETERVGRDGMEFMLQDELRGKNGYISIPINPQNMIDGPPVLVAPAKGHNVHSTINKQIQLAAEQAITDQLQSLKTIPFSGKTHENALTGYAVAMEVDTGNVVAMASMPDYDANVWKDGISKKDYEKSGNGTISPFNSGQSKHKLPSVIYMGSTIKPLSVLIGLNEGLFGRNDYYPDRGIAQIANDKNATVTNSGRIANGPINPQMAIQKSSNAFMIDMVGEKLYAKYGGEKGLDKWGKYMKEFGLGVSTESGLPSEFRGHADYENYEAAGSYVASLAYASFGQNGKYTTLQLAQYAATLANRGSRIKPQLVSKITDQEGRVVKKYGREVLNKVDFPQQYWDTVIRGMNTQGLTSFEGFGYDFARKTGTSQQDVYPGGSRYVTDNGIFIGFAPRQNPKLVVAVVIPEGGFGAYSAAPVARKIFDAYDEVYGLDGTPHPKKVVKTEDENKDGQVNNETPSQ